VLGDRFLGDPGDLVEVEEVAEEGRVDEQRRVDLLRIGLCKEFQLAVELLEKRVRVLRVADDDAYLVLHIHRLCERHRLSPITAFSSHCRVAARTSSRFIRIPSKVRHFAPSGRRTRR